MKLLKIIYLGFPKELFSEQFLSVNLYINILHWTTDTN